MHRGSKVHYSVSETYPKEEKFGLVDDMKRAARSTTHNIAEGFGRYHFQENIQFCRISRGSLCELIDQLITSKDEGFITDTDYKRGRELIARALPLLNGYINYLSRQKNEFRSTDDGSFESPDIG